VEDVQSFNLNDLISGASFFDVPMLMQIDE